jgi:hypothetical protein
MPIGTAFLKQEIELVTSSAVRVFKRTYSQVGYAIYLLTEKFGRKYLRVVKYAEEAHSILVSQLDELEVSLKNTLESLEQELITTGLDNVVLRNMPVKVTAYCENYPHKKYSEIIMMLDRIVSLLDVLASQASIYTEKDIKRRIRDVEKRVYRFSGNLRYFSSIARRFCMEVDLGLIHPKDRPKVGKYLCEEMRSIGLKGSKELKEGINHNNTFIEKYKGQRCE